MGKIYFNCMYILQKEISKPLFNVLLEITRESVGALTSIVCFLIH